MKTCACGALFSAAIPGNRCAECGGLSLHPAPEWVDVTAAYRPWFTLAPWRAADGWVLLAGARIA